MKNFVLIVGVVYPFACGGLLLLLLALAARRGYRRLRAGFSVGLLGFYLEADDRGDEPRITQAERRSIACEASRRDNQSE
jgi:hypothetical protein